MSAPIAFMLGMFAGALVAFASMSRVVWSSHVGPLVSRAWEDGARWMAQHMIEAHALCCRADGCVACEGMHLDHAHCCGPERCGVCRKLMLNDAAHRCEPPTVKGDTHI